MKKQFIALSAMAVFALASCNSANSDEDMISDSTTVISTENTSSTDRAPELYNLETKEKVNVVYDEKSKQYVGETSGDPIHFYYDPISRDTFDSRGRLVNNALVYVDGKYNLDEAKVKSDEDSYKMKIADLKVKMEADGDTKIKNDDMKIKETDDKSKLKTDDVKIKQTDDKTKIKTDDGKVKITDEGVKVKDK